MKTDKMLAADRHKLILSMLKEANNPITARQFAEAANVSRQVIVQDISILKAKNEPILATSQGYIYLNQEKDHARERMVIACKHTPEQTREELYILVDHGVSVNDVTVEHPVYGELTAALRVSTRNEVDLFIEKIKQTNSTYLLTLTDGIHLHAIEADSRDKLEAACKALAAKGMLVFSEEEA
ncbi:transcription repressor NadR [Brevibacillus sp. TJ4]|uniref:transcription repressor NadR n=1 Tax=Brevibacillus sp. TJ4 TaxID=3234853 RepID=UPI0037D2568F